MAATVEQAAQKMRCGSLVGTVVFWILNMGVIPLFCVCGSIACARCCRGQIANAEGGPLATFGRQPPQADQKPGPASIRPFGGSPHKLPLVKGASISNESS